MKNKLLMTGLVISASITPYAHANYANTKIHEIEQGGIKLIISDYGNYHEQKIFDDINITSEHVLEKNAYPIKVQILNNTDKNIMISPQSFNVSSIGYEQLAKDLHYHEIIRPLLTYFGIGVVAMAIGGITTASGLTNPYTAAHILQITSWISLIGNIKQWWDLRKTNKQIDINLCDALCLHRSFIIPPNGHLNKIVLFRKNDFLSVPKLFINIYGDNNKVIETFSIIR